MLMKVMMLVMHLKGCNHNTGVLHFPHKFIENTPYELLKRKKPDVSFFRVFECKCYIYKKCQHLRKFQRRCDIGYLVGYSSKSKAYRVLTMLQTWLKKHLMLTLMKLMAPKEQVIILMM